MRKTRSDKKYKFTKAELQGMVYAALVWASDGLAWHIEGKEDESQDLVMGSPEDLSIIIVEALTSGLPGSEDSPTSAS